MTEENKQNQNQQDPQPPKEPQQPQQPPKQPEPPKEVPAFRTFKTQEEFDNEMAKVRGGAERNAKKDFLKMLGIDNEDKIEAIKQAYQNSLTEAEKKEEQLKELANLKLSLAEKEATITALKKFSNKGEDEITKIVKMAKGLVSDEVTLEQALDDVMKLFQQNQKQNVPSSQTTPKIPDGNEPTAKNPFKDGNLTEMGQMIKENPEKARKLAKEAGYPINF